MPIYAFRCEACGHGFDRLQKLSDADPRECPECGESSVKRQVTAPSFRLAGSGWYETDFKKDAEKKRNLADKGEPAKADAKPDAGAATTAKSDTGADSKTAKQDAAKPAAEAKPAAKSAAPKSAD